MASQGPNYPSTASTAAVAPENANDWLDVPGNITGQPTGGEATITAATYDAGDISFRLLVQGFGFTLPTNATILGITVSVVGRRAFAGSARDSRVQLLDETGALVGDNKATATAWPTTSGNATYGGTSDTWNWTTVTATKLNDPDFGVVLSVEATAANTDIGVDGIGVTVEYSSVPNQDAPAQTATSTASAVGLTTLIVSSSTSASASGAVGQGAARLDLPLALLALTGAALDASVTTGGAPPGEPAFAYAGVATGRSN